MEDVLLRHGRQGFMGALLTLLVGVEIREPSLVHPD